MKPPRDPGDLDAQFAAADRARDRLAAGLKLPTGLLVGLAAAIAVQIGTAGYGIAEQTVAGLAVVAVGLVVYLAAAMVGLWWFRRVNGVRLGGLASQVVFGTGWVSSLACAGSLAVAIWASFEEVWWIVVVAALVGGAGYAFGVRRWWAGYQRDPATHARGESPLVMLMTLPPICLGIVLLLVIG